MYAGLAALLLAGIAVQSWSGFVAHTDSSAPALTETIAPVAPPAPGEPPVIDMSAQPVAAAFPLDTIDVVVGRNDTLDRIFRRLDLNLTDLASIRLLPGIRQGLEL